MAKAMCKGGLAACCAAITRRLKIIVRLLVVMSPKRRA